MAKNVKYVNTPLRDGQIDEFAQVKRYLGIAADADVVRYLVRKAARQIQGAQPQTEPRRG
jgi:hypothetical protein